MVARPRAVGARSAPPSGVAARGLHGKKHEPDEDVGTRHGATGAFIATKY